jgi:hypothetical protein
MTNTARLLAVTALSALLLSPLAACGAPAPSTQQICLGPEVPDDLEDLYDRDVVRYPDDACRSGDPLYGFASVQSFDVPPMGEEVGETYASGYRSSHVVYLRDSNYRRVNRTKVYRAPSSYYTPRPGSTSGGIKGYTPAPKVKPAAPAPQGASKASSAPAAPVPSPKAGTPSKANTAPKVAPPAAPKPAAPAPKAPAPAPKPATKSGK